MSRRKQRYQRRETAKHRSNDDKPSEYSLWKLSDINNVLRKWEPIGLFVAVIALIVSGVQFNFELEDREDERIARKNGRIVDAWQLLTTQASGNSGKVESIEFLLEQNISLDGLDMSCETHGGKIAKQEIVNSTQQDRAKTHLCTKPVYLRNLKFVGTPPDDKIRKDIEAASFRGGDLVGLKLENWTFRFSDFSYAVIEDAEFEKVAFIEGRFPNYIAKAKLKNISITGGNIAWPIVWRDLEFVSAWMQYFGMRESLLSNVVFRDSLLNEISLNDSKLYLVSFFGVDLDTISFDNTEFHNINLSNSAISENTGLTQAQLDEAWAWDDMLPTGIPAGFHIGKICPAAGRANGISPWDPMGKC